MVLGDHRKKRSLACGAAIFLPHIVRVCHEYAWRQCIADTNATNPTTDLTHRADDLFLWQRDPLLLLLALTAANLRSLYRLPLATIHRGIVAGAYLFHSL